jgi:hypothetical protein
MSIESKLAKAEGIEDARRRLIAAHALVAEVDGLEEQVSGCRAMAAAEAADEGTTFQDLADAIGVSKTLIQQLVSKGRHLAASRASEAAKAIMAGKA